MIIYQYQIPATLHVLKPLIDWHFSTIAKVCPGPLTSLQWLSRLSSVKLRSPVLKPPCQTSG